MSEVADSFHRCVMAWAGDLVVWHEYPALHTEMAAWLEKRLPVWEPALICCLDEVGLDHMKGAAVVAAWFVLFGVSSSLDNLVDGDKVTEAWKNIGKEAGMMLALAIVQDVMRKIAKGHTDASLVLMSAVREAALGEASDLAGVSSLDEYEAVLERKAGILVSALFEALAVAGSASKKTITGLRDFGRWLGLAIQIANDYWGIWDPAMIGLSSDGDLRGPGHTYPLLYLVSEKSVVREEAQRILEQPGDTRDIVRLRELLEQSHTKEFLAVLLARNRMMCQASLVLSDTANQFLMRWADTWFFSVSNSRG